MGIYTDTAAALGAVPPLIGLSHVGVGGAVSAPAAPDDRVGYHRPPPPPPWVMLPRSPPPDPRTYTQQHFTLETTT